MLDGPARLAAVLGLAVAGSVVLGRPAVDAQAPVRASTGPVLEQVLGTYCLTCHNTRTQTGSLSLEGFGLASIHEGAGSEVGERVLRRMRSGMMPPAGMPRPDRATLSAVVARLEAALDGAEASRPQPGRAMLRRLNRSEYGNAVRDLLALDIDAASLVPSDNAAFGFDNIADALGVSPALQERYLSAAEKLAGLAVGDTHEPPDEHTYTIPQDVSQDQHIDGLPFGTLGGARLRHLFPLDGEYEFHVRLYRSNLGLVRGLQLAHPFELSLDGARVHGASVGGAADLDAAFEKPTDVGDEIDQRLSTRLRVAAGPREVGVAFAEAAAPLDTMRLRPFLKSAHDTLDWTGRPHIQSVTIRGPFKTSGAGDTPSRRRVFTCRPGPHISEDACARQIVTTLLRRAYRQAVDPTDLRRAMSMYTSGRREGAFDTGIQRALQFVLASPRFVFRAEREPAAVDARGMFRISHTDLASQLSFFLWSTIPDNALLDAAARGSIGTPAGLEGQVRRMLADPRSDAIVANFVGQWLQLRNIRTLQPNSDEFPDFDDNLRRAFRRETELLFRSVMDEDRSVLDLLTADYTYVNERLARHYGIGGVYGSHFRRVPVADVRRRGLLGHGGILALTSHATRTSPVLRGKWVLENVLGTPPPPPPANVPALKENERGQKPRTMREQLAEHRANPACASCHKIMDPIGFAMENFDAVGAWRTVESGAPIDASGELVDGTRVDGVVELRDTLVRQPEVFVGTMVEKLLIYALGRGLTPHDMPTVRAIVRDAAAGNYRFSAVVLGVVKSTPFQMRMRAIAPSRSAE
jgi:hypothetical protein